MIATVNATQHHAESQEARRLLLDYLDREAPMYCVLLRVACDIDLTPGRVLTITTRPEYRNLRAIIVARREQIECIAASALGMMVKAVDVR